MNSSFAQFNPNTTRWDPNNALALALAARLAYSDEATIRTQLSDWGFPLDQFSLLSDGATDTQGFVIGNAQMILVSFRGTQPEQVRDWLTDLDALLHPFPVGMVHWGFYDALDTVLGGLRAAIDQCPPQGQSLWFTGHSLGAALATIAVARCLFEQPHLPINGLYTFGSPRPGDFTFGRAFDQEVCDKTFRFVNNEDLVTRVPPRCMFFSHVGQTLFFDETGVLQNDDHWWNRFLRSVEIDFESLEKLPAVIEDHKMDHYVDNLAKYLDDLAAGRRKPLAW